MENKKKHIVGFYVDERKRDMKNIKKNPPKRIEAVKLPKKVKLLYSVGEISKGILNITPIMFCLYFYVNVLGISSSVAATVMLISKIWDIINDPIMGAIVDRTHSKEGKCRVWLKYVSLPGGIAFALTFMMPAIGGVWKIVWIAITYTLQSMAGTAFLIPANTLCGRLTSDPVERASMNQYKGFINLIPNLCVTGLTMPLVLLFGGENNMQRGFLCVGILYGIFYALGVFCVYIGTRGYEPVEEIKEKKQVEIKEKHVSAGSGLKVLIKNNYWLFTLGMYFVYMLSTSIATACMTFYCQYNLGNVGLASAVSVILLLSGLVVYSVLGKFVKRFGNARTAVIGCIIGILGYAVRFVLHDTNMVVVMFGIVLIGFSSSLVSGVIVLCIFDSAVYGEWKTGVNSEAILMSGYSVSYKTGQALGSPIAGYILALVPFVANAAKQEKSVLNVLFLQSTLLPLIGVVISLVCAVSLVKYEKQIPKIQKEMEARKSSVTE